MTRLVTFKGEAGNGDELAGVLLRAASIVAEAPGCELWLVHRDLSDPDIVRVTEVWASPEHAQAALQLDGAEEYATAAAALLAAEPEVVDCEPIGGARVVRGSRGASAFAILDAPDLSQESELLASYGLSTVAEARYVREQLGALQSGLTHYRMDPDSRQGWAHRHSATEEIYVALSGSGRLLVDGEPIELGPLHAIRVAPASTRELEAGPAGLEVLAFGPHLPGDGEDAAR
jgi:quinol monooxygenase YgiN/mannose-6-phosphate isomerase-like protein (cupin superfamily)